MSAEREWALNKWLNLSQAYLVAEIGEERVNALIEEFRLATRDDQMLWTPFYNADDPYRWLYERSQERRH